MRGRAAHDATTRDRVPSRLERVEPRLALLTGTRRPARPLRQRELHAGIHEMARFQGSGRSTDQLNLTRQKERLCRSSAGCQVTIDEELIEADAGHPSGG